MGDAHPSAAFEHNVVNTKVLSDALFRVGQSVVSTGINGAVLTELAETYF